MRLSLLLLLTVVSFGSFAAEPAALPAPQLLRLESELTRKLAERDSGALPPDQYRSFAETFRADLDAALAQIPETPVNRARHAMILARLDDVGQGQAVAGLDRALEANPGSAALLNAKGSIQLQQGDYAGALASAEAVLKENERRGEQPDPEAIALRQFSKGRGAAAGGKPRSAAVPPEPGSAAAGDQGGRQAIQFTQRATQARVDVPLELSEEKFVEPSLLSRGKGAVLRAKNLAVSGIDRTVLYVGRKMGIRSEQEEAVLRGAHKGGKNIAKFGVVAGGAVGAVACSPGIATGAGYAGCIGVAGTVGGVGGYVVGSYWGGLGSHAWMKTKSMLGQLSINPETKPEEE